MKKTELHSSTAKNCLNIIENTECKLIATAKRPLLHFGKIKALPPTKTVELYSELHKKLYSN